MYRYSRDPGHSQSFPRHYLHYVYYSAERPSSRYRTCKPSFATDSVPAAATHLDPRGHCMQKQICIFKLMWIPKSPRSFQLSIKTSRWSNKRCKADVMKLQNFVLLRGISTLWVPKIEFLFVAFFESVNY